MHCLSDCMHRNAQRPSGISPISSFSLHVKLPLIYLAAFVSDGYAMLLDEVTHVTKSVESSWVQLWNVKSIMMMIVRRILPHMLTGGKNKQKAPCYHFSALSKKGH